jgi:SWI/SNF-related matrix-associated actin-dependent regulator of chromatin subfamily A member 5
MFVHYAYSGHYLLCVIARAGVCACVCACVYVHVCMRVSCVCVHVRTCVCLCVHVHVCVGVHLCTCMSMKYFKYTATTVHMLPFVSTTTSEITAVEEVSKNSQV